MPLLQAIEVSKHFPRRRGGLLQRLSKPAHETVVIKAVENVSLAIDRGEIVGLIGQSGSGKTTLVRILLRLTDPTHGRILIQDTDVSTLPESELKHHLRRCARMIFQHPDAALNPAFTVERILGQALTVHSDLPRQKHRDKVVSLLDAVGLPPQYVDKYPHELSGGEKRRVSISRALATDPLLLIADEPVSGLDVSLQAQILNLLATLRAERGVAILLISHDVGLVRSFCDRIGVMYAGRLVEEGPRDAMTPAMCRHPYTRALYDAQLEMNTHLNVPATAPALSLPGATGCPYRPSCARYVALDHPARCEQEAPLALGTRHRVACHFSNNAEE